MVISVVAAPRVASAQVTLGQTASAPMSQPLDVMLFPVEIGALSSHVGLQFGFARATLTGLRGTADLNVMNLGLQAQYAFADIVEVGINLPFLVHGWTSFGAGAADTELGNIRLDVKVKLLGSSRGMFALSAFANTTLPTTSGDIQRDFVLLQAGLAATGNIGPATFGAALGTFALIGGGNTDIVLFNADIFGAARLHRMFGVQVAMQIGVPIEPSGGEVALSVMPAVQFFPIDNLHIDAGARIAITDTGKLYTTGGRAALVVAAAYNF